MSHQASYLGQGLSAAEMTLDKADRSNDPQWISYLDEAYMSTKFGQCFRALGQPKQAEGFAKRSLDMDPAYVRGRAFNLWLLATSYAQQGEVEQACLVGRQGVSLARELNSKRAVRYIPDVADGLANVADRGRRGARDPSVSRISDTAAARSVRLPTGEVYAVFGGASPDRALSRLQSTHPGGLQ